MPFGPVQGQILWEHLACALGAGLHGSWLQLDEFGIVVSYQPPELYDREIVDIGRWETDAHGNVVYHGVTKKLDTAERCDFEQALDHASENADFETVVALMSETAP